MHFEIFGVASRLVGVKRSDNRLALWPPKLHVVPILLGREVFAILEIVDSAVRLIPAPVPRPVEDL